MKAQLEKSCWRLAMVLGMVCTQFAPAQSFKPVTVNGGVGLVQIAAGGATVWARARNGKPYIYKAHKFVLASPVSLAQIAVGGGSVSQADSVWGIDSAGNVYNALLSGTKWVFARVPGVLDFIAVGTGYSDDCHPYEVWGLNPAAQIYRYNYCLQNWEQVAGTLNVLAVGNGVWGVNGVGEVYRFTFSDFGFQLESDAGTGLLQVTVGPSDIWARRDGDNSVYRFDGKHLTIVQPGLALVQIQSGGSGFWGIDPAERIFHLDPTGRINLVPGTLTSISVGSGVWGLDSSGKPYVFSTP